MPAVYNCPMPLPPLIPAIIGSIIESAAEQMINRPTPPPVVPAGPVVGMLRTLPANSLIGVMEPPSLGVVQISGQTLSLSPAAQIRDERNMLVMPTAIPAAVPVRFTVDPSGAVQRIWILTAAELEASLQAR